MRRPDPQLQPAIVESFFEFRQVHSTNWIDLWGGTPNPFLTAMLPITENLGVDLADISLNPNPASLGEVAFTVLLKKLKTVSTVTLSSATFFAENPSWEEAPSAGKIHPFAGRAPRKLIRKGVAAPGHFTG